MSYLNQRNQRQTENLARTQSGGNTAFPTEIQGKNYIKLLRKKCKQKQNKSEFLKVLEEKNK